MNHLQGSMPASPRSVAPGSWPFKILASSFSQIPMPKNPRKHFEVVCGSLQQGLSCQNFRKSKKGFPPMRPTRTGPNPVSTHQKDYNKNWAGQANKQTHKPSNQPTKTYNTNKLSNQLSNKLKNTYKQKHSNTHTKEEPQQIMYF